MLDVDDPTRVEMDATKTSSAPNASRRLIEEPKRHLTRRLARAFGRRRDGRRRCERRFGSSARAGRRTRRARPGAGLWRRRTKAGCFLWVFKRAHGGAKLEAALRESRAVDRALQRETARRIRATEGRARARARARATTGEREVDVARATRRERATRARNRNRNRNSARTM